MIGVSNVKTNSFAFSSAWGLTFMALSALIINTHFLNSAAHAISDPTTPILERTIYIEADSERQSLGYDGYTLSPRAGGYRVEVVGNERHEGTILIESDWTSWLSINAVCGEDESTIEVFGVNEPFGGIWVDEVLAATWFEDTAGESIHLVVGPAPASTAMTMIRAVFEDANFGDDFGNFVPIPAWLPFVALAVAVASLGVATYNTFKKDVPPPTNPAPTPGEILVACANLYLGCQGDEFDPLSWACQEWLANCPGAVLPAPPPDQALIESCQELADMCADPNNPYQNHACTAYYSLGCDNI
jgi:hypothetical protein